MTDLPGAELIERGLADRALGTESEESLLVEIAHARLRALGHAAPPPSANPELRLYRRLCESGVPDPYSSYNALLRRLGRYLRALEARSSRTPPRGP